jgi:hypothetical protein
MTNKEREKLIDDMLAAHDKTLSPDELYDYRVKRAGAIAMLAIAKAAIREEYTSEIKALKNALLPSLTTSELRLADKNCNWVSFKCAFNAVMKSRRDSVGLGAVAILASIPENKDDRA